MSTVCLRRRLLPALLCLPLVLSGCGGGGAKSSSTSPSSNPVPSLSAVAPASLVAGSASQTVTLSGTNFIASTAVTLNGAALATTYVNATTVKATVPAAAIAADGSAKLVASNPSPGGGTSSALPYSITVPTATIASLSPQGVTQGAAANITITGAGFEANSVAQWNGSPRTTTYINNTTLQVALSAADVQNFGVGAFTVLNPGLAPTTPLELDIIASTPTITSVSPNSYVAFTGSNVPVYVFINGSGFAANATVQANGQLVSQSSMNATLISLALPASWFAKTGPISFVVTNPGSPAVSSNAAVLTVTNPSAPILSVTPNSAPAGSNDTTITLNSYNSNSFYTDSVVKWNNTTLAKTFVNSSQLTAVIPAALLTGFAQASITVTTPENTVQPAAQPFDTYLPLPVNDIVYNAADGYIYASIPGSAGENLGNTIAAIDPANGVIQKTIYVGSQPNRLALSTDGKQLFVGLDGAGSVRQVDLTTATAGTQFYLGGGNGIYVNPFTALSLAAVPGSPNSVAVYASDGVATIYDAGVARAKTSSGLSTYFDSNVGGLAFGSSASTLYVTSNAIGGYLYQLTVDSTGITASTQIGTGTGGSTLQYDNGLLYTPVGLAFSASSGAQAGQFSVSNGATPLVAAGPIASDSTLNRAWILPTYYQYNNPFALLAFDEKTYDPVGSVPVTGIGANNPNGYPSSTPADLIRWGTDGLAFHTPTQLYVLQGPIVKDNSSTPADVSVSIAAASTATTGASLTYTLTVANQGPNQATGISLSYVLPASVISGSVQASQGSCSGEGISYCDLGTINSGSSATVTVKVTPSTAGPLALTATVGSVSYDPLTSNNQATVSTAVTGAFYSPAPTISQLSPSLVQAGSGTFILTVDGLGFTDHSTINWNGSALTTTLLSTGQLTATVDASLTAQLGWSQISVTSPAPGGGTSAPLPFTMYQVVNVPANAMAYDPFTRKLYAVLPSTSPVLTGNSILAIDPATGAAGTPLPIGSEPNLLSETSDGNYLYIGLSGAKSLGKFNLLTQSLDATIPLPTSNYPSGGGAAISIATVPGSDSSLAVETGSFYGIGILDIAGTTATLRSNYSFGYSGDNPVFVSPTEFYALDSYTSGAQFYRYTIDGAGAHLIDGTTLDNMGGFGGRFAVDGGLVYGTGGGIANPATTPPAQVAVLQFNPFALSSLNLNGGAVVPYAAERKSFDLVSSYSSTPMYLERFDTQHFTLEDMIPLPANNSGTTQGTRWGQDGLAFILPATPDSTTGASQIFLIRGPWVLPAEAVANSAPTLTSTDHDTLTHGAGNTPVTVTGSGFLPGATVLWNNAARTTNYVDASHLTVSIPASDVTTAATINLTCQNPGSGASNTIHITIN